MENDNGREVLTNRMAEKGKAVQVLQRSFDEVKEILERNRVLIQEIEQNHKSREPRGLNHNVALIQELNSNMALVINHYFELSTAFCRGLTKGSPAAADAANNMARAVEYYSDLYTSSSLSFAKGFPTDTDAAKEG